MATKTDPNSIVDYLKSVGQSSSLSSRKALGAKYGIDYGKTTDNYATQNTALLAALRKGGTGGATGAGAVPTPAAYDNITGRLTTYGKSQGLSEVNSPQAAYSYINNGQENDFNDASADDAPPARTSTQTYEDMFSNLKATITPSGDKPDAPNFTKQFESYRNSYGITDLETDLNSLKKEAQAIKDASAARTAAEGEKPVAMNVIAGRQTEEQRQDQLKLDPIVRQIEDISNQLTTKYKVVDNLMAYGKLDYDNAVKEYDTQFSQNLQIFNTIKGIVDTDKSNTDKVADNARANLQIIYNNLSSGGADFDSITSEQKANITKLELQAGLPVGFYSSVQLKNPKASILSTTTRDAGGTKYADIIMKNDDGTLSVKSIKLGASSGGSDSSTQAEILQDARSRISPQIQAVRGGDGYVSPDNYIKFRDAWTNTGLAADDFDKNFKQYANPSSYSKLGITF